MEATDRPAQDDLGEREKQLIEARRAEAMALFATAHTYNARNDQLVAAGVAVLAAAAAVGLKQDLDEVFLGIPVALLLLLTYAMQVEADMRVMGAARRRLEAVLNTQLGAPALLYELHVVRFRRKPYLRGISGARFVLLVGALGATVAGGVVAFDKARWAVIPYAVVLASLWACLYLATRDARKAECDACRSLEQWAIDR